MNQVLVTKQGYDDLIREKNEILTVKIPHANEELAKAREQGDLSENSAYTAAREERETLSRRLDEVNELIQSLKIARPTAGVIGIGSKVVVDNGKTKTAYKIVGEVESNPKEQKISNKSPLGSLLMGKQKGDSVELKTDTGKTIYKIIEIE